MIWDGAQFLAGGRGGVLVEGYRPEGALATSWYRHSESPRNWLWSIVRTGGIYAACGDNGGIFTSVDGYRFEKEYVPDSAASEILEGIGGKTNLLVAVGTGGTVLWSPGGFTNVVSTNSSGQVATNQVNLLGLTWFAAPKKTLNELEGIGVFGDIFIASGGGGTILTSPDARDWTLRASGVTRMLSSVTASPARAVITGDSGTILTSENSVVWTQQTSGVTNWITQTRFLNGQFVGVGESGIVLTSPDGLTWTRRASGLNRWLNAVSFHDGSYYAAGGQGAFLRSPDAITWTPLPTGSGKSYYGIAGGEGRLALAGVDGVILRTRLLPWSAPVDFISFAVEDEAQFFLFSGELDQRFQLQRTRDFISWLGLADLELLDNTGAGLHFDAVAPGSPWFFRTLSIDP